GRGPLLDDGAGGDVLVGAVLGGDHEPGRAAEGGPGGGLGLAGDVGQVDRRRAGRQAQGDRVVGGQQRARSRVLADDRAGRVVGRDGPDLHGDAGPPGGGTGGRLAGPDQVRHPGAGPGGRNGGEGRRPGGHEEDGQHHEGHDALRPPSPPPAGTAGGGRVAGRGGGRHRRRGGRGRHGDGHQRLVGPGRRSGGQLAAEDRRERAEGPGGRRRRRHGPDRRRERAEGPVLVDPAFLAPGGVVHGNAGRGDLGGVGVEVDDPRARQGDRLRRAEGGGGLGQSGGERAGVGEAGGGV